MRTKDTILPDILPAIRFIARVLSFLLLLAAFLNYIYQRTPIHFDELGPYDRILVFVILLAFAGLAVGWVSELSGGMLTLICLVIFSAVNHYAGGDFALGVWVLGIPALLFAIYGWRVY